MDPGGESATDDIMNEREQKQLSYTFSSNPLLPRMIDIRKDYSPATSEKWPALSRVYSPKSSAR